MHALILVKSCLLKYFRSRADMVMTMLSISRSSCLPHGSISNSCTIPVLRNYIRREYIFMFSKINSAPESASSDTMNGDKVNEADLAWCQYEGCLGEFWHWHHIPKTVARPAYLWESYPVKTSFWYWTDSPVRFKVRFRASILLTSYCGSRETHPNPTETTRLFFLLPNTSAQRVGWQGRNVYPMLSLNVWWWSHFQRQDLIPRISVKNEIE